MKVARLLGVALMAVIAVSAMLASTASAIPLFRLPITHRNFTATSGTSILRTPSEKDTVTCATSSSSGTILDDDEVSVDIHFLSCFLEEAENGPCTIKSVTAPGTEGLTLTELLTGLLGLLHEPPGADGILFEPVKSHVFVTFAPTKSPCKTGTTAVEGSVGALFSPSGKLQNTALINLGPISATGHQQVTLILTLHGIVKPKLTSFGAAESTQEQTAIVKYEEAVEVM